MLLFSTGGNIENKHELILNFYLLLKGSNRFSKAMKALPLLVRSKDRVKMTSDRYLSDHDECKENWGGGFNQTEIMPLS